jgi:hypothetical protein
VYIELVPDGRDARKLQSEAAEAIHRELPSVRVVDHVALADAMLWWSTHPGHPCVDCGDLASTGWSWHGELRALHGGGLVVFSGATSSGRCCPDKYFFRQVAHYLRTHGSYPFAQASNDG